MADVNSYRSNYIKTYIFQAISFILGFVSLFIIVPYLSHDKILYGTYSVCTSLSIFFSYADLGFLSSANKYAAEYYVRKDLDAEQRIIGFTAFVMLLVFVVLAGIIFFIGLKPELIIPEIIAGSKQFYIAKSLLITLAISCPIIIAQRILSIIYTIRVEEYKYQSYAIVGSIIKILSVFVFFYDGKYQIVEYYIFYQFVNLLIVLIAFIKTKQYGYKLSEFASKVTFNKYIFNKVKGLTGTLLLAMIAMVLYNELDQIAISNIISIEAVAVYSIAFSALSFVRSYISILFSPYASRYNHYTGLDNEEGLILFVRKVIILITPLVVIPIITLSIFSKSFIISWVGELYSESATVLSILVFAYIINCFKEPLNSYLVAKEQNSVLRKYNILLPIFYWFIVLSTIKLYGLYSFAVAKTFSSLVIGICYVVVVKRITMNHGFTLMKTIQLLRLFFIPSLAACIVSYSLSKFSILNYSASSLLLNLLLMMLSVLVSIGIVLFFNKELRRTFFSYVESFMICIKIIINK